MHRTQIMLEEAQYQTLRECARQDGKTMGKLARELIAAGLDRRAGKRRRGRRLDDLKGLFREPDVNGRDHDAHLYGGR
jgi:hypothetical protein